MHVTLSLATTILLGVTTPSPVEAVRCEVAMAMRTDSAAWLDAFNQRWAQDDYPPIPVHPADLEQAERDLAYTFPATYRGAVQAVGLPRPTADLWDAIDEEADLPHLGDFLTPNEIVGRVRDWRPRGYPTDLVPFATDSSGNLLSFRTDDGNDAVHLWDHDFGTVQQIAPSFVALLEAYCSLSEAST